MDSSPRTPAPAASSAERGTAAWFTRRVTQATRTGSVRQLGRERRDLDRIEPSNVLRADLGGQPVALEPTHGGDADTQPRSDLCTGAAGMMAAGDDQAATIPRFSRGISMAVSDIDVKTALLLLKGIYSGGQHKRMSLPPECEERKRAFDVNEAASRNDLLELILGYIEQRSPPHPLCLAVFGPPGSGKSFGVKKIIDDVIARLKLRESEDGELKLRLPMTTLNLTQVSEPGDIAAVLSRIAGEQTRDTVPVVFFDEFDASRHGAPFGWLSWFLAPMHDGEILHAGAIVRLQRAIYVFAGGTTSTMKEFSDRASDPLFRQAKGPDFISRLRGYLDVLGPNDEPRALRRAVLIENALKTRASAPDGQFTPDDKLLEAMLQVGRYRHGSRSIFAIIEISKVDAEVLGLEQLPHPDFVALHADRGPLDRAAIGGFIVFSGFPHNSQATEIMSTLLPDVAKGLWSEGATLAFGGSWSSDGVMAILTKALESLPRALRSSNEAESRLVYFKPTETTPTDSLVEFLEPPPRPDASAPDLLSLPEQERGWVIETLHHFGKRLMMSERSVARIAISGATRANHSQATDRGLPQRFPGVVEEVMLSLALRKPVYILGKLGGAAEDLGKLLGLTDHWTGDPLPSFTIEESVIERLEGLKVVADRFRPPPLSRLPVTFRELKAFFRAHAVGTRGWPDNGLSLEQNRQLFASKTPTDIVKLVRLGLTRRLVGQ